MADKADNSTAVKQTGAGAAKGAKNSRSRTTARGKAKDKSAGATGRKRKPAKYSLTREILLVALQVLGILFGLVFFGVCCGVYYGANMGVGILKEVSERTDNSESQARIDGYEEFFESLNTNQFEVHGIKPNIQEGVTTHQWTVKIRGSGEECLFWWEHDFMAHTVSPKTNPALCLDVQLGFMTESEAVAYTGFAYNKEKYLPNDPITLAVVHGDFSQLRPIDYARDGGDIMLAAEDVGAPLISPDAAKGRMNEYIKEVRGDEETPEEPEPDSPPDPNTATEVSTGD